MWKNKWKIIAYGGLLYFFSIGVPLYAQADSLALRGKDSLTYQIPISRERPESLRSFHGVPHSYDSSAFDYSETSGRNEAFLSGMWKAFIKLITRILEFIYGKGGNGMGMREILRMLGAILFLVSLFFFGRWILKNKGRWLTDRSSEKLSNISMEEVEKHLHQTDFSVLIQNAEKQNDTRQSIRLYYLWLLKVLSDKKQIEWDPKKTNSDYEREIKDPAQKERFIYLSKLYNYIWYGEFLISDAQYQEAKADYQNYINTQKAK